MSSVYLFLLRLTFYNERKAEENSGIFMVRYVTLAVHNFMWQPARLFA